MKQYGIGLLTIIVLLVVGSLIAGGDSDLTHDVQPCCGAH